MKRIMRKGARWLLTLVILVGALTNVDIPVNAADSESITLGAFVSTGSSSSYSGSFNNATGTGTKTYKGLTIGFSKKSGSETINLPNVSGYTYDSSLSTSGYTYVVTFDGKTAKQVAEEYIRKVTFGSCNSSSAPEVYFILHADTPSIKTIYHASNDHFYQYVKFPSGSYKTWTECYYEAKKMKFLGRSGYLATVTSEEENHFVYTASGSVGWLGGTRMKHGELKDTYYYSSFATANLKNTEDTENYWYWACGPEIGKVFYGKGKVSQSSSVSVDIDYNKWNSGEPNGPCESGVNNKGYEVCATTLSNTGERWNDVVYDRSDGSVWCPTGYFVEYGDQPTGDSHSSSSSEITVTETELCVYATLKKSAYTITVKDSTNGVLTSSASAANENDTITLTATPDNGYMLDDIAFINSNTESSITMTALTGTQDKDSEGYAKLFDGNTSTKWCSKIIPGSIVFKASDECILTGYKLTTANDTASYSQRNWKAWTLYGANFDSDEAAINAVTTWTKIASINNDNKLSAANFTSYNYTIDNNDKAYKYYLLQVESNGGVDAGGNNMIQMSEMTFTGYAGASIDLTDKNNGTYTFTMPASNVIVVASFIPKYKVTYSYDSSEVTGSAVNDDTLYQKNQTVTVKGKGNLSKEGFVFAGWRGKDSTGKNVVYKEGDTFTITGDVTLTAYWKESIADSVYANDYSDIYDGEEHGIYVVYPEDATVTYSNSENGTYTGKELKYKNAGTYTVYYKVEDSDHLESIKGSAKVEITKKPITIGIDDQEITYGSSDPVISPAQCMITDSLASTDTLDSISVSRTSGMAVGEYGYTLSNAKIKSGTADVTANYNIAYGTNAKLIITKRPVTISSITASKEYDGTTVAAGTAFDVVYSGKAGGDDLEVTVTGAYADKNVGNGKNVSISDISLTGEAAANYELAGEHPTSCKGTITQKSVTVSGITAVDKIFDRTTDAELNFGAVNIVGLVENDDLQVEATGKFADASVGKAKRVDISGLKLTGKDVGNYVLAASGRQTYCEAAINPVPVVVNGITASNKVYDGSNSATLVYDNVTFDGILTGDSLTVSATGTFVDKNVANGKRVLITNLVLSGTNVENYTLATKGQQVATTADITKKTVNVSGIKAVSKEYDGTTTVQLDDKALNLDGKIEGDDLTCVVEGGFADAKIGNAKPVNIEKDNIKLAGKDAGNYDPKIAYEGTSDAITADITPALITVSGITAETKVYDGTKTAALILTGDDVILDGLVEGEKLFVTAKGEFEDENAGTGKTVNISDITLTGDDRANYILAENQQTKCEADITPKPVVVSGITAENKGYDGNNNATLSYEAVVIKDTDKIEPKVIDDTDLTVTAIGKFDDVNVGTDKTVSIFGITLTGTSAGNYMLAATGQQTECKANITGLVITVSGIKAKPKTYDGKTGAILDMDEVVLSGKAEGDRVLVSAVGEFEDEKAGTGKKVTIRSMQLTGKDAANYSLAAEGQQTECEGTILPKDVIVSGITAESKVYDGTTDATLVYDDALIEGKLKADKVTVTAKGTFSDKLPGSDKDVVISDYVLGGADAANYKVAEDGQQEKTTADITIVNDVVDEDTANNDGTDTHKETEYKNGKVSRELIITEASEGDTSEDKQVVEKTINTYDEDGNKESGIVIKRDLEGNIVSVTITDPDNNETLIKDEAQVTYGGKDETVDEIKDNLKKSGVIEAEAGSVLASELISPDEMAHILKNDKMAAELITKALEGKASGGVKGGADVTVTGMNAVIGTDKAEMLKLSLTPTEMVMMLSSGKTTEIILELKENKDITGDTVEAKKQIAKLLDADEDVYYFDCDLYKVISGSGSRIHITEPASKIKIGYTIPSGLQKKGRTYQLIGSHKDMTTGAMSSYVIPSSIDDKYVMSFETDKLCLMALSYTDDDIKARNAAAKEAAEKEAAAKAEELKEKEALAKAKEELDNKLADAIKAIDSNTSLDATAKDEAKKIIEAAAVAANKELDSKGSSAKESVNTSFDTVFKKAIEDGVNATKKREEENVTPEKVEINSLAINEGLKIDQKGSKINIAWGKVDTAEKYDVYVQYCGKSFAKTPDKTVKSTKTKVSVTKINGKKLNLKKNYKIYVVAYKVVDGKKVTLGRTITAHVVGRLNTKCSNAKDINITSKTKLTLKKGKTSVIKAKTVLVTPGKKQLGNGHAAEFRYASSDKKVATVDKTGKIKAVGKGECIIYVYSRNGYTKKITVTVK